MSDLQKNISDAALIERLRTAADMPINTDEALDWYNKITEDAADRLASLVAENERVKADLIASNHDNHLLKAELAEARKNEVDALEKSLAKNGVIHSLKEEIAEWNRAYNTQTHQIATLKAELEEILLVAHGGAHNDTICTVERKL